MRGIPALTLNSGHLMPIIGLGTWQGTPDEVELAVKEALKIGYRLFDTAVVYENEQAIGTALKKAMAGGDVIREEIFVTTKLPEFAMAPEFVKKSFVESLERLQMTYIDLYLIHVPVSVNAAQMVLQGVESPVDAPPDPSTYFNAADTIGIWREMEKLVEEGLVKSIGLSNFNQAQIEHVWDHARIKPACLQVECHAYLQQQQLQEFCQKQGVTMTGFSSLGAPLRFGGGFDGPVLLDDPVIRKIAERCHKTPAQVLLRWLIQRNIAVIPKSVSRKRLRENFAVFDFNLNATAMRDIEVLGKINHRYIDFAGWKDSPDYPFAFEK